MKDKIKRTDKEWKRILTPKEYHVREKERKGLLRFNSRFYPSLGLPVLPLKGYSQNPILQVGLLN
jgi:hypothetical protein